MTVKEFWQYVDGIDVDSRDDGRYTEDEMFEIGRMFKSLNNSQKREIGGWDYLVTVLKPLDRDGNVMSKGDTFRQWVKDRCYRDGVMEPNVRLLSGQTIKGLTFDGFEERTEEIKRDLYKQQVRTRDSLNAYCRVLREEARLEDFKDLMREAVTDIASLPEVRYEGTAGASGTPTREAVLMLSDLHIGVKIDNYFNTYNTDICRRRLEKVLSDTISYCRTDGVGRLYVLLLGDTCQGLIHTSARLEQQMDVTKQIMLASELLADFINRVQEAAPEIVVCTCTDNHCRMMPNLHESIEAENYGLLIPFYLKARLAGTKVRFKEDNLDQEIGLIEFENGRTGVFMHGHHDNVASIFQNMAAYTRRVIDYGFIGHYHCERMRTFNTFRLFINSSLVGMDQYAFSKRLFSRPSQTLVVLDGDNVTSHIIGLENIR